jgi:hypothetical protein
MNEESVGSSAARWATRTQVVHAILTASFWRENYQYMHIILLNLCKAHILWNSEFEGSQYLLDITTTPPGMEFHEALPWAHGPSIGLRACPIHPLWTHSTFPSLLPVYAMVRCERIC